MTTPTHGTLVTTKERMGGGWVEKMQPGCLAQYWGERKEAMHFLASPRYLTGERTDQRSLSMLRE